MEFNFTETFNLSPEMIRLFLEILIVLGIGLLVGLERQYSKSRKEQEQAVELFAGVRTFPLVAIIGYISIYLGDLLSYWIFALALVSVAAFAGISYYAGRMKRHAGATTEFALLLVFLLSGLVYTDHYLLAVFVALTVTALLAFKVNIHWAVSRLSQQDILSILLFAVITALILPLLPDKDFGPYGALNPFKIWLIVTIYITLNFVGYFLHKFIDTRYSILATGVLGGFASSTATAWYFSRLGGKEPTGGTTHVAAIILASSIMFPRLLIWLFVLNAELLIELWIPVLIFGIIGFGMGYFLSRRSLSSGDVHSREIENPINLRDALTFGVLYIIILMLVGYADDQFGSQGVYYAAGISGLTDVDAMTISMANYAKGSIEIAVAAAAVLIAAWSNTLVKYVLCLIFGNKQMRRYASYAFLPILAIVMGYVVFLLI